MIVLFLKFSVLEIPIIFQPFRNQNLGLFYHPSPPNVCPLLPLLVFSCNSLLFFPMVPGFHHQEDISFVLLCFDFIAESSSSLWIYFLYSRILYIIFRINRLFYFLCMTLFSCQISTKLNLSHNLLVLTFFVPVISQKLFFAYLTQYCLICSQVVILGFPFVFSVILFIYLSHGSQIPCFPHL